MSGKKATAPCGHPGEFIIGRFIRCDLNCGGEDFDEDITLEILVCPKCKSLDIDDEFDLGQMYYFFNPGAPILDTRCENCGNCWARS